jgi:uncharacterized surface protein with fasciclin (FAS1) repeats
MQMTLIRSDLRHHVARALLVAVAAMSLATASVGCTSSNTGTRTPATRSPTTAAPTGRLCDQLPSGKAPGNPAALTREPADAALQWIPVLTKFEAAIRASGLAADLRDAKGVTILAPTDDAFTGKISERAFEELVLFRKDELRTLLKSHLVDRSLSLSDLVDAGNVTTLAGTSITVSRRDGVTHIADRAETVCGDYRVANGRIHIINGVLGNPPNTAGGDDPAH